MKWKLTPALLAALAMGTTALAQVTFVEDFDDGAASTRWSAPIVDAELGAFDGSVDYGFDYGAIGIPAAPNSGGSTTGALFQVNLVDDGPVDEGVSVGIIPTGVVLPSSYNLKMDAFFNAEFQSSGSTEYGIFGVHTAALNGPGDDAVNGDVPFRFSVSDGNGLAWSATGDAGASDDFFRFEDPGNANAGGEFALGSYDDIPSGTIPGVSTGVGAVGPDGVWVEIEIDRVGARIDFKMNGFVIDSILDISGDFDAGSLMIGLSDAFNSAGTPDLPQGPDPDPFDDDDNFGDEYPNLAHFLIFDNVTLTQQIPEPTSALLGVLALAGLAAQRRR